MKERRTKLIDLARAAHVAVVGVRGRRDATGQRSLHDDVEDRTAAGTSHTRVALAKGKTIWPARV